MRSVAQSFKVINRLTPKGTDIKERDSVQEVLTPLSIHALYNNG